MQTQHAREAVGVVKQHQAHVLAMAMKAEDAASISEQSCDKFVRENTDRKQKLQDGDRIQATADLLAKHTKAHTDKDELLLQLQVARPAPHLLSLLHASTRRRSPRLLLLTRGDPCSSPSVALLMRKIASCAQRAAYPLRAAVQQLPMTLCRFTRNCSALMGAGEFSTIKTANLAMIQATRQLMVRFYCVCGVFVT